MDKLPKEKINQKDASKIQDKKTVERKLDKKLKDTFPASDSTANY